MHTLRLGLFCVALGILASSCHAQYLGSTTSTCGKCIIPDNSCNSRPTQDSPCSATNVGTEQAIPTGTTVNVYINSDSEEGFPTEAAQQGIETAFVNWQAAVNNAVKFTFTVIGGCPVTKGTAWIVQRGTTPSGTDGNTSWNSNTSGDITFAQTNINSNFAFTQISLEDLMTHEIAHPMGFGDENNTACEGVSVTYEAGNTLGAPSTCDKAASKSITCAGGTAKCKAGPTKTPGQGGAGQGGGEAPEACAGGQPNPSCQCDGTNWDCECSGSAPGCNDGTSAICYNGAWDCGTVTTTQCTGVAPTCNSCQVSACEGSTWVCETQ